MVATMARQWGPCREAADIAMIARQKLRPGIKITTHGTCSTFRDWCGEETEFPREIAGRYGLSARDHGAVHHMLDNLR